MQKYDRAVSCGGPVRKFLISMRILLKRFPKYISYLLWSVVLFRLLCPITLEFGISLVPNLKPVFYEYRWEEKAVPAEWPGEPVATDTVDEAKKEPESAQATVSLSGKEWRIR